MGMSSTMDADRVRRLRVLGAEATASGLGQRSLEHVGQGCLVAPVRLLLAHPEQETQAIEAHGHGVDADAEGRCHGLAPPFLVVWQRREQRLEIR
jgi:hypothetical protein